MYPHPAQHHIGFETVPTLTANCSTGCTSQEVAWSYASSTPLPPLPQRRSKISLSRQAVGKSECSVCMARATLVRTNSRCMCSRHAPPCTPHVRRKVIKSTLLVCGAIKQHGRSMARRSKPQCHGGGTANKNKHTNKCRTVCWPATRGTGWHTWAGRRGHSCARSRG